MLKEHPIFPQCLPKGAKKREDVEIIPKNLKKSKVV